MSEVNPVAGHAYNNSGPEVELRKSYEGLETGALASKKESKDDDYKEAAPLLSNEQNSLQKQGS